MSNLAEVEAAHRRLTRATQNFASRVGQAKAARDDVARMSAEAAQADEDAAVAEQAGKVLLQHSEVRTDAVRARYEGLGTQGLEAVFGEGHTVTLQAETKAGRSEAQFLVTTGEEPNQVVTPIMESRGGGLAAAVGFVLRAATALSLPGVRPVLVLDEAFAQVSAGYEEPLALFIKELCSRSGLQVILVTHSQEDVWREIADVVHVSSQKNSDTSFKTVKSNQP